MNYKHIQTELEKGNKVFRAEWDDCRYVRKAEESDVEFINYPTDGIIVEDCNKRQCDCNIAIYQPTKEDTMANDWYVLKVFASAEN